MIDPGNRHPKSCAVTSLTDAGGLDMELILSGRLHTVMTGLAVAQDSHMVKGGRQPGIGRMTVITGVAAIHVIRCLAGGDDAIMTGRATSLHLEVIHLDYRYPEGRAMTGFADICSLDVVQVLSSGGHPVVTGDTRVHDIHMIKVRRQPCVGRMAVVTGFLAGYVIGIFTR